MIDANGGWQDKKGSARFPAADTSSHCRHFRSRFLEGLTLGRKAQGQTLRFYQQLPAQVFNAPNSCWIFVIGLNTEIVPLPPQLMPTSITLGKVVIRKTGEPLSPPAFP